MARETITRIKDDLTGQEISESDVVEHTVNFQGKTYTLETTKRNAERLDTYIAEVLDPKVEKRLPHFANPTGRSGAGRATNLETHGHEASEVRAWGIGQNLAGKRGRLSQKVYDEFHRAHS
jgi:hypothetical protein